MIGRNLELKKGAHSKKTLKLENSKISIIYINIYFYKEIKEITYF